MSSSFGILLHHSMPPSSLFFLPIQIDATSQNGVLQIVTPGNDDNHPHTNYVLSANSEVSFNLH